jgi:hypothetical protein
MIRADAAVALAACALGGCRADRAAPTDAAPPARVAAASVAPDAPVRAPGGCRAIAVEGEVSAGDVPVPAQGLLAQDVWLSLGQGARLVAKDTRSTRETTFVGPGRARACVDRHEESWLAAGTMESAVGAGETPGAEEWIVTPLALVRYAAAKLRVEVRPKSTAVTIGSGVAFVWLADGSRATPPSSDSGDDGDWKRLNEGATTITLATRPALDASDARLAVDRCSMLAQRSRDLAAALLSGGVGAGADASTVALQVETRRLARAACGVAALRLETLASADEKAALSARVAGAVVAWSTLPAASRQ